MRFCIIAFLLGLTVGVHAQSVEKYWVYLNNEVTKDQFIRQLDTVETTPSFYSNWLHALVVFIETNAISNIKQLPGVASVAPVRSLVAYSNQLDIAKLGFALEQINGHAFIEAGLNGKGVKIGIIDGGFLAANEHPSLSRYFKDSLVKAYKDYLTPEATPYEGNQYLDDQHGTDVWEMIGGFNTEKQVQFGLATHASIYLARTDHGGSERRIEEDYFVQALEWLDSCGVRLVNASVGYTFGYDNPNENYNPEQMDGSTAIAKACQYAATQRGMLIVVAAGNEGDVPQWKIINTPADAKDVLAVGSCKLNLLDKMSYSSEGPEFLPYLKPEISCFASRGTSFSTPLITGLAAAIWQYDTTLTNHEVKQLILESGNLFPYGNNHVGHGVPDCEKILQRLKTDNPIPNTIPLLKPSANKVTIEIEEGEYNIVVYHKINDWYVVEKELFEFRGDNVKIRRFLKVPKSTVIVGNNIWEISWP